MTALQQLQLENEILRESLRELQSGTSNNPPPVEPHPPSTPSPTPSSSHQYVLEPVSSYPINSTARGCIFMASSTKLGLSFVYNPNVMLAISLGSASLAPFSPDRRKRGLRHWSRPHPHSWVIFLPSLRSWKPRSGRQTDEERHPQSCTPYNMAPVQHPSMLLSFSKSCAMSYRT